MSSRNCWIVGLVMLATVSCMAAEGAALSRVSVGQGGAEGNAWSDYPSLSNDGRYVAFASHASNLVPGDLNAAVNPLLGIDVFRYDRLTGVTIRVSVASDGGEGNGNAGGASISSDGRCVAFWSDSNNLVPGDTNGVSDIFIHDCVTGETIRVSIEADGGEANGPSVEPCLSGDGNRVAFTSMASNIAVNDVNANWDIFVRDLAAGQTMAVSVDASGWPGNGRSGQPTISADGSTVAFASRASNLVTVDTNLTWDVFARVLATGVMTLESVSTGGVQGDRTSSGPSLSGDGRSLAFVSKATTLIPGASIVTAVYLRDRVAGTTERISATGDQLAATDGGLMSPRSLSADGRYVALESGSITMLPDWATGAVRILRYDRQTGQLTVLSMAEDWTRADNEATNAAISGDGRFVAFASRATNLVPADANGAWDVFLCDVTAVNARLIQAHRPTAGATRVSRRTTLALGFGGAVADETQAGAHFYLKPVGGEAVAGTLQWPLASRKVLFVPAAPLAAATVYEVGFTAGVRRRGVAEPAAAEGYRFTTGDQPVVVQCVPAGTNVTTRSAVSVVFDQAMHRPSVQKAFRMTPAVTGVFEWRNSRTLTFRPTALAGRTEYRVTLAGTARSATGRGLGEAFGASFKTAPVALLTMTAAAAPVSGDALALVVTLNRPATVSLEMRNMAGRCVARVPAQAVAEGSSTVCWRAVSATGSRLAGGMYLASVEARAEDGSVARTLVAVQVEGRR